jgi:mRNA-degrading endonuclease RelE of RelBE toxin-antitoxin system
VAATTDRQLPADAEDGPPPETLVAELSRLRRRLSLLNEEYQERHDERNQLRREIKSLRQQESQSPETSRQRGEQPPEPAEEEGLPLESVEGIEPRLPSFGPDFVSSLAHIPRQVRAAALKLIGRLAAGERSAYAGCVKLKRVSGILRARVGRDYRLLFRLESSALKVVDIVHRQGLEQRINRLADSVLRKN